MNLNLWSTMVIYLLSELFSHFRLYFLLMAQVLRKSCRWSHLKTLSYTTWWVVTLCIYRILIWYKDYFKKVSIETSFILTTIYYVLTFKIKWRQYCMIRGINTPKFNLILYNSIYRAAGNNASSKQWNSGILTPHPEESRTPDRHHPDSGPQVLPCVW